MTNKIDIDDATYRRLEDAARLTGVSVGAVVAGLVDKALNGAQPNLPALPTETARIRVFADYAGVRTHGEFEPGTTRIEITSGPLAGTPYGTPSQAAVAVVQRYKPEVDPNRNGWTFWVLDDGSGARLQSIRHR